MLRGLWALLSVGLLVPSAAVAQDAKTMSDLFAKGDAFCARKEADPVLQERCRAIQSLAAVQLMQLLDQHSFAARARVQQKMFFCMADTQLDRLPNFAATLACTDPERPHLDWRKPPNG